MILRPEIRGYRAAIRDAYAAAGMVRCGGAVSRDTAVALYDRLIGVPYAPRVSAAGVLWVAPAADVVDEVGAFVADLLGAAPGDGEASRYRKGSWSEAEFLEQTNWILDLTPVPWDEADGGHTEVDGVVMPIACGSLDVYGAGREIATSLLTIHRDRLFVRGVIR